MFDPFDFLYATWMISGNVPAVNMRCYSILVKSEWTMILSKTPNFGAIGYKKSDD